MMQNVDIAIIGGGMVGLTLAAALADTELRVAVIEGNNKWKALGGWPLIDSDAEDKK